MKQVVLFKVTILFLPGMLALHEGWVCFTAHKVLDFAKESALFAFLLWFIKILTRHDYDDWVGQF